MDDRLTNSQISCAMTCPRRHQFAYVDLIRPVKTSGALQFGKAWHKGLEAHSIESAIEEFDKEMPQDADLAWFTKREMLARMLEAYWRYWGDISEQMIAAEIPFELPLRNPESGRSSRTFSVAGKIDGIMVSDGRTFLLEHKTAGEDIAPGSDYWGRLRIDLQISIYWLAAIELGYEISGVIYDVARKPGIKPSLLTQADTKLLANSSEYLGRHVPITFNETFTRIATVDGVDITEIKEGKSGYQIRENVPMFGYRLSAELASRPEHYFQRQEIPRLEMDLEEAAQELWWHSRIIADGYRLNRWPRNTQACAWKGRCPYFSLCTTGWCKGMDLPEEFRVATSAHEELDDEEE